MRRYDTTRQINSARTAILAQFIHTNNEDDRVTSRTIVAHLAKIGCVIEGDEDDQMRAINAMLTSAGFTRLRTSRLVRLHGDRHNRCWTSVRLVEPVP
jgi:hypothetical protein